MELKPIALDELQFTQLLEAAKRTASATERTANLLESLINAINDFASKGSTNVSSDREHQEKHP